LSFANHGRDRGWAIAFYALSRGDYVDLRVDIEVIFISLSDWSWKRAVPLSLHCVSEIMIGDTLLLVLDEGFLDDVHQVESCFCRVHLQVGNVKASMS
jgi:hypothetical protein